MEKEEATSLANGGEEEEEDQQKGDNEDSSPAAEKAADEKEEEEVEEEEDEDERVSGQHLEELKAGLAALLPSSSSGANWLGVSREEETSSDESFEIISNPDSSEGSSCSGEFIETPSIPDEFQAVNDPTEEPQEDKSLESSTSEKAPSSGLSDVDLHGSGSGETLASSTELVFDARSESSNEPRNSDIMSVGSSGHSMDVNVCTDEESDSWETLSSTDPSLKVRSSSPSSSTENFEKIFPHGSSDNEPSPSPIEYASDSEAVPSSEAHSSRNLSVVAHNASCDDIPSAEENKSPPVHRSPSPALLMPESAASSNVDLSVSQTDSMEKTNLVDEDQLSIASDAALSVNDVAKPPEEQSPKNKASNELPKVQSSLGECSGDLASDISVRSAEDSDNAENKSIGSVTQNHPEKLCDERAEPSETVNEKESTELADNSRTEEDESLQHDPAELSSEEKADAEMTNEAGLSDESDGGLAANDLQHLDQDPHVVDSPVCDVPDHSEEIPDEPEEITLEKPTGELIFKPSEVLPSSHDESSRDSSGDYANQSPDRSAESGNEAGGTNVKSGESADESSESAHELGESSDELDESGRESSKADNELGSANADFTESNEASDAPRAESPSAPDQVLSRCEREAAGDSGASPQDTSATPLQELDDSVKCPSNGRENDSTSVRITPRETEETLSSSDSDQPQAPAKDGNSSVTDGNGLQRDKSNFFGPLTFLPSDVDESSQTILEQRYVENLEVIEEACMSSRISSKASVVYPNYRSFRKRKAPKNSERSSPPVEIDNSELPSGTTAPKKIYLGENWTRDTKWRLDMELALIEKNGKTFELETDYTCKFPNFTPPKPSTEFVSDPSIEVTEDGPTGKNENCSNMITKCDFSDIQKALDGFNVTDKICFESKNGCSVVFECCVVSGRVEPCPVHYYCTPAPLQDAGAQPSHQGEEREQLQREAEKEAAAGEGVVLGQKIDAYLIPGLNIELPFPSTPTGQRMLQVVMFVLMAVLTSIFVGLIFPPGATTIFEEASARDVIEVTNAIKAENKMLRDGLANLQEINIDPIKIKGKEGARARELRQTLHRVITDNEDMRLAVGRLWLTERTPTPQQRAAFSEAVTENHRLRMQTQKLRHLGVDVHDLENSLAELKQENDDLKVAYAEFKYQRVPLPKELAGVSREVEGLAQQVNDAERKRKPPPNLYNAKSYATFMGQVLSTMSSLHEFGEASAFGKLDIASDVFTDIAPKATSIPPAVEQKLRQGRAKFEELKQSLAAKWSQVKALSEPENIKAVGRDTLTKMNRVLVNVVGKMKEIAHATLLKRGQTPVDKTATALTDKLTVLDSHFDKTWNELENEVDLTAVDAGLAREMRADDGQSEAEDVEEQVDEVTAAVDEKVSDVNNVTKPSAVDKQSAPEELKQKANVTVTMSPKRLSGKRETKSETKSKSEKNKLKKIVEKKKKEEQKRQQAKKLRDRKRKDSKEKKDKEKKQQDKNRKRGPQEKQASSSKSDGGKADSKSVEETKYFKGHYNKDKGKNRVPEAKSRFRKTKDDDDDDDDDDEKERGKKQSRLQRHWERPSKKNSFRNVNTSRHQFIRRKGETGKTKGKDWVSVRSQERSKRRLEGKKSDWLFDRAHERGRKRRVGEEAEWQFSRAGLRRRLREAQKQLKQKQKEKRNLKSGYADTWRTLKRAAHRRGGDDDDDDDDYDYYGRNSKFVKRDTLDLRAGRRQHRRPQFRNR